MLKHSIFEGFKNLIRSFWLSVTAIFVIIVSLISVSLVSSLWVVAGFTLRQLDNQAIIYVYLKDGISQDVKDTMYNDISKLSEVKEIKFINKEEASTEYNNNPLISQSYKKIEDLSGNSNFAKNLLKESFKVTPQNSESFTIVSNFIDQEKYQGVIDKKTGDLRYVEVVQNIYYWTGVIGAVLVLIFSLISILVMINILRIAIYSRREEIEIMRLVGATNGYIRGPFVAEGIYYNLISSIIVFVLFIPLFLFLAPQLASLFEIQINTESTTLISYLYIALALTNFGGLVVGGVSALIATQRYLKL
jgi:cell division transport system permease protein